MPDSARLDLSLPTDAAMKTARAIKVPSEQWSYRLCVLKQLRNSEHAQKEVRQLAEEMLNLVKNIEGNPFEKTIKAFNL